MVAVDPSGEVIEAGWTVGIDATVEWMTSRADTATLAMVDAPLVVTNRSGQCTCEAAVGRSYGRWKVSANSTNLSSPRLAGQRLRVRLEALGWLYDPGRSGPNAAGRRVSECYPYATLVGAPELGYDHERPVYKRQPKRTPTAEFRAIRAEACNDLLRRMGSLRHADPPLILESHPLTARLLAEPSPLADREYKHREDLIDAALCAWTGLFWLRWGLERCQVLGDETSDPQATIIAPVRPSQRRPPASRTGEGSDSGGTVEPITDSEQYSKPARSKYGEPVREPTTVPMASGAPGSSIEPHNCRCATLPASGPKCGRKTKSMWSLGCDGRSLDAALRHLGFVNRTQFISWAANSPTLAGDPPPST